MTAVEVLQPTLGLDLPAGVQVTDVGFSGRLTPAQALAQLGPLRRIGAAWRWHVGDAVLDLIDRDTSRMHEVWGQIRDLDLDTRPSLMRSIRVALEFPLARRRPGLGWGHHDAVQGMEPEAQDAWLDEVERWRAGREPWSVDRLEAEIRKALAPPDPEPLVDPGPAAWTLPTQTQRLIAAEFARDPEAKILLTAGAPPLVIAADGTRRAVGA